MLMEVVYDMLPILPYRAIKAVKIFLLDKILRYDTILKNNQV